jgi:hypothetical protein
VEVAMKKRNIIIVLAAIAVLTAGSLIYNRLARDPNFIIKHSSKRISEGKAVTITYDFGYLIYLADKRLPAYIFTPEEDSEYIFTLNGISSETGDILVLSVTDRSFSDYLTANNLSDEGADVKDSVEGKAFLQKGQKYYIFTDASSDGSRRHKGSFVMTVSAAEETEPPEISPDDKVKIRIGSGEQADIRFVPPETGYYRFDSEIVSGNAAGFSSVIGASAARDDKALTLTDGMCWMEEGVEYYLQIGVNEIRGRSAEVEIKCRNINSAVLDDDGCVSLESDALIRFTAEKTSRMVIYSESDGDPEVDVYDGEGFELRSDDDSGKEFGGGKKDFAAMIDAEEGQTYHIYVHGSFKKCDVNVINYTDEAAG